MKYIIPGILVLFSLVFGEESKLEEGHSMHGEVFNVGPRQSAVLIEGTGNVHFPVTTKSETAQAFFDQGIGQIHGYWDFEAERSFREAAAIDPDCAMAYWGMAMANYKNAKRGKGFIAEAVKRRDNVSEKEQRWINSLAPYFNESKGSSKDRRRAVVKALREIVAKYPDDIEAKAFLFRWEYQNSRKGIPISNSNEYIRKAKEVLAVNPHHPIHHYVIHYWDRKQPANALESSEQCGPSAPAIAHMWHMPGHIYSKLKRYHEAAWYQEASARVDHAHMMKFHLLPDQIHNFAHNNEWLARNLNYIGRCRDAVSLAKNMSELPRIPKFRKKDDDSTYDSSKSSWLRGRPHIKNTLVRFEKWEDLLALENTPYLETDERSLKKSELQKLYAIARFETGDFEGGQAALAGLKNQSGAYNEVAVYEALNSDPPNLTRAKSLLPKLRSVDKARQAMLYHRAGNSDRAVSLIREAVRSAPSQVHPLAVQVEILYGAGKTEESKKAYSSLLKISSQADHDLPIFQRIAPIAKEPGYPEICSPAYAAPKLPEACPDLDSLGPFRWSPPAAPDFALKNYTGKEHHLSGRSGKATLLIFYLGKGCVHCMEQLNEFAPAMEKYQKAGIDIVAISSDTPAGLAETFATGDDGGNSPFPFPLLSDADLTTFKKYRAFDDFENQPLHGTFLIDSDQKIRWQDIGFEPFMYSDWLLEECTRLLGLGVAAES